MIDEADQLRRVRASYDAVATTYAEQFSDELDHKPLDRALLAAFCDMTALGRIADIGCGSGHISRFVADRRSDVLGVDLSPEMVAVARRRHPDLTFEVASMTDLPYPEDVWSGVLAMYSIIHLSAAQRSRAFAEFARTLRPGGRLLVAFHVDGPGFAPGAVNQVRTFLGHPVEMDGYFLEPADVIADLIASGFRVQARMDREPIPAIEFPSRRCYLVAESAAQATAPVLGEFRYPDLR
jgi:SAM-dependent methyltransferase